MRKISYILISGCITLSIIGCDETFDTSNPKGFCHCLKTD